jgi:hypothetical protein
VVALAATIVHPASHAVLMGMRSTTAATSAAATGVTLAAVSAFTPWVVAHTSSCEITVVPATSSHLQAGTMIELAALVIGAVLVIVRRSSAALGVAGALWFNISIVVWVLGIRAGWILPTDLIGHEAVFQLGVGAIVATVAGLLIMSGVVLVLIDATWSRTVEPMRWWLACLALLVVIATMSVRTVAWLRLEATGQFSWRLGFDGVPLVGDTLTVLLIVAAAGVMVAAIRPRRWLALVVAGLGVVTCALGVVGLVSRALIDRAATWAIDRAQFLSDVDVRATATAGPVALCGVGVLLIGFSGIVVQVARRRPDPRIASVSSPATAPDLPELPF